MALYFQLKELRARCRYLLADSTRNNSDLTISGHLGDVEAVSSASERSAEKSQKCSSQQEADQRYASLPDITVTVLPSDPDQIYYQVGWESETDILCPRNWSLLKKSCVIFALMWLTFVLAISTSIDAAISQEAAKEVGVSKLVESLAMALFLIGFGSGTALASPLSEFWGRYPVYLIAMIFFGGWLVGAALSPNLGSQLSFRFLAGLAAAAPLTLAGGSISDTINPRHRAWVFCLFAVAAIGGPISGPAVGSFIGKTGVLGWRWSEWIVAIADAFSIILFLCISRETLSPRLLAYKSHCYRQSTGDDRFLTQKEAEQERMVQVWKTNFKRPMRMSIEPIVFSFSLYLSILYIILFTFLDGFETVFMQTYGISSGLSNLCFLGLLVGLLSGAALSFYLCYLAYKKARSCDDGNDGTHAGERRPSMVPVGAESQLIFANFGAPLIPIGLFWMAWTDYSSISIWSPLLATLPIGAGMYCIFCSAYLYVIDAYETYAASALTLASLLRFLAAAAMTVGGIPMYDKLGPHWTLTILGCLSLLVTPIPYLFSYYGPVIRKRSKLTARG